MKNNNFIPAHFEARTRFISGVLREILQSRYGSSLIFKGGTMIELFLNGGRFSEDLDFNVKTGTDIRKTAIGIYEFIKSIGYDVSDFHDDWTNVYNMEVYYVIQGERYSCQIEIFKDSFGIKENFYIKSFSGNEIALMGLEDSFAHKCCAYIERGSDRIEKSGRPKGRDLYDVAHYLKMGLIPNMNVIKVRLGFNTLAELFTAIYYRITIEHGNKLEEFAFEIENFALTKVDGLELITSLLREVNKKFLGGRMRYDFRYKQNIDLVEKAGTGNFQLTDELSCVFKDGLFRIVDIMEMKEIYKVVKKEKLKEYVKEYILSRFYG